MPRYRFQWANLSPALLDQLASGLKLEGDPIEALQDRYGSRPKPEFIKDAWPILISKWLSSDHITATQVSAALKEQGLGDIKIEDNIIYLKSCRNTSGLRIIVIEAFIELGESGADSAQDSLEGTIAIQPERLTGAELIAKAAELGDASKPELVRATGYFSITEDGTERLEYTSFYEALLEAKGIFLDEVEPETNTGDPLNDQEARANKIISRLGVDKSKLGDEKLLDLQGSIKAAMAEYYYKGDDFWEAIENVSSLLAEVSGDTKNDNEHISHDTDAVIYHIREQLVSISLLEKISENIHINSMARLNNRDRVQGALGILNPEDLEETVGILLNWDVFEGSDPSELAEALAFYYSTLAEPKDLNSLDLQLGFDDDDESLGSLEGWVELARRKGVSESEIAKFLAEIKD